MFNACTSSRIAGTLSTSRVPMEVPTWVAPGRSVSCAQGRRSRFNLPNDGKLVLETVYPKYVVRKVSGYPGANRREAQKVGIKD